MPSTDLRGPRTLVTGRTVEPVRAGDASEGTHLAPTELSRPSLLADADQLRKLVPSVLGGAGTLPAADTAAVNPIEPRTCLAQRSVKPLPPTLTLALGLFALDAAGALVGAKLPLRAVVMAHTKLLREYSILRLAARAAPPGRAVGVLEARLSRRSAGRWIDGSICIRKIHQSWKPLNEGIIVLADGERIPITRAVRARDTIDAVVTRFADARPVPVLEAFSAQITLGTGVPHITFLTGRHAPTAFAVVAVWT